jgi:hypothetical protein
MKGFGFFCFTSNAELADREKKKDFAALLKWCGKSLLIESFTLVHLTIQTRISRGERGAHAELV